MKISKQIDLNSKITESLTNWLTGRGLVPRFVSQEDVHAYSSDLVNLVMAHIRTPRLTVKLEKKDKDSLIDKLEQQVTEIILSRAIKHYLDTNQDEVQKMVGGISEEIARKVKIDKKAL